MPKPWKRYSPAHELPRQSTFEQFDEGFQLRRECPAGEKTRSSYILPAPPCASTGKPSLFVEKGVDTCFKRVERAMGIEPKRTIRQSLKNTAFRDSEKAACDWCANFRVMRDNVGQPETIAKLRPLDGGFTTLNPRNALQSPPALQSRLQTRFIQRRGWRLPWRTPRTTTPSLSRT
jgi:hypothetical protein